MLPQVTFRGLAPSQSIVDTVWRRASKLGVVAPQIKGCHVVIEASARGSQRHVVYRVVVHMNGGAAADRRNTRHASADNVYVALRDAFDAARRQLEQRSRHPRGDGAHLSVLQ
jgi:ribosome-associated translation inhibitor RaiA